MKKKKLFFFALFSAALSLTAFGLDDEEEAAPKIDQKMTIELMDQSIILKVHADVAGKYIQTLGGKMTLPEKSLPLDCSVIVYFASMNEIYARWQSGSRLTTYFKVNDGGKILDGEATPKILAAHLGGNKFWMIVQVETKTAQSSIMYHYGFYAQAIPDGNQFRIAITKLLPQDCPFAIVAGKPQEEEEKEKP